MGAYSRRDKDVLYCVVSRLELPVLKDVIHDVDPQAFVVINKTYDLMGYYPTRSLKEGARKKDPIWVLNEEDDAEN